MKTKERIIWIVLFIILITIFWSTNQGYKKDLIKSNEANIKLIEDRERRMQIYKDKAADTRDLEAEIEKYKEMVKNQDVTNGVIITALKEKGFTGELEDIISDLQTHTELIPHEGSLGGNMGFYSRENIHVLTDRWVWAYFEDGHIFGYMLLKYDIKDQGIHWEVIDSYLFQ